MENCAFCWTCNLLHHVDFGRSIFSKYSVGSVGVERFWTVHGIDHHCKLCLLSADDPRRPWSLRAVRRDMRACNHDPGSVLCLETSAENVDKVAQQIQCVEGKEVSKSRCKRNAVGAGRNVWQLYSKTGSKKGCSPHSRDLRSGKQWRRCGRPPTRQRCWRWQRAGMVYSPSPCTVYCQEEAVGDRKLLPLCGRVLLAIYKSGACIRASKHRSALLQPWPRPDIARFV